MDNLTHALVGVAISKAFFERGCGRTATWVLLIASNLPDIDAPWTLMAEVPDFCVRRMLTHSVFGMPVLGFIFAVLFFCFSKKLRLSAIYALTLLGMAFHVFLDLVNSYGVVLFYPLSRTRYEFSWIFIIDFAIWGILSAPIVFGVLKLIRKGGVFWARISLVLLACYVGLCAVLHGRSMDLLRDLMQSENKRPDFVYVFPEPLGPHRFRGVTREKGVYRLYLIRPFSGRVELKEAFYSEESHPWVRKIIEGEEGRNIQWFFKAPVWRRQRLDSKEVLEAFDLRFHSLVLRWRKEPYRFWFPMSNFSLQDPKHSAGPKSHNSGI